MKVRFVEGEILEILLGKEEERDLEERIKEAMDMQDGEALLSIVSDIQKGILFPILFQGDEGLAEFMEDALLIEYLKVGDTELEFLED